TPTPTATVGATATLAAGCPAVPEISCRTAHKSLLVITNITDDATDKLIWKWKRGQSVSQTEYGDPTTTAEYALCVYDNSGFRIGIDIPPDAMKWSPLSNKGYEYRDQGAAADGVTRVLLNTTTALLQGKGPNLP